MTTNGLPRRWTCLAVDLEGYGRRTSAEHAAIQRQLVSSLDRAATSAGLDRRQWIRQAQGDGELSLIPDTEPTARLVGAFVDEVAAELYRHNGECDPQLWMRMRMALDEGPVDPGAANGFVGRAVVGVSRLADSDPLRAALREVPTANLAVLVSGRIYEDLIHSGHADVDRELWRPIEVVKKEYRDKAWLRVPRTNVHNIALAAPPPPEPPAPAPVAPGSTVYNIHGNVEHAGHTYS